MKKFLVTVYFFILASFVFAMSGCGGSGGGTVAINDNGSGGGGTDNGSDGDRTTTQSAQSRRMIFTSSALKRGKHYRLFLGKNANALELNTPENPKFYLSPVTRGSEDITLNLEFSSEVNPDLPFTITEGDGETVVFSYTPKGTGEDTTTRNVMLYGDGMNILAYSSLTLTGASVELEESEGIIDIVLKSDGTATVGGTAIEPYDYVWHADPQHPAQYWTLGANGTEEYTAKQVKKLVTTVDGVYIARDIRYTPDTLNFTTSQTASKDEDTEYVVYYDFTSEAVRSALADVVSTYGSAYSSDKYIFATLPMSMGMGGGMGGFPGGNMPSGDMGGNPPSGMPSGDMGGNPPGGFPGNNTQLPIMGAASDSSIAAVSTMLHSSADAYANPVLHITEPGTYRLSGTWNGQIWVDVGGDSTDVVGLILNGVTVKCTVAPALVFYKVYKWAEKNGYDSQSTLSANNLWRNIGGKMVSGDGYFYNGAIVEIADGTTNTFTGANVYRILELCPKLTDSGDEEVVKYTGSSIKIGTDIGQQEKMYKLDGAFHSRRSMVIGGGEAGTGTLNITSSTYEGLDSEMHLVVDGGNISVTAPDDAINVNEDYVSVFQMDSGTMTISSTNADGIDSNGWVSINGGTLNITAGTASTGAAGEAGIDAENGYYISNSATYNWTAASSQGGGGNAPSSGGNTSTNTNTTSGDQSGSTGTGTTSGDQSGTDTGTTTYNTLPVTEIKHTIGNGAAVFTLFPNDSTVQTDTEGARSIPSSGYTFILQHRVNDFAGIK